MDLRIVKTKKAIQSSFLTLRERQQLSKIRVTELCELAQINKTTFYKYYVDIYALSDEMTQMVFAQFWSAMKGKDLLIADPEQFINNMILALNEQEKLIYTLFRDNTWEFGRLLKNELRLHYISDAIKAEKRHRMEFAIEGLVDILMKNQSERIEDPRVVVHDIAPLIRYAAAED